MNPPTIAEQHSADVKFIVECYKETYMSLMTMFLAGGQIPGIEVNEGRLQASFDKLTEQDWAALATQDPTATNRMLEQYRQMAGGGT